MNLELFTRLIYTKGRIILSKYRRDHMNTAQDENRAIRRLRRLADVTCRLLSDPAITLGDSMQLIFQARTQALAMFPEKTETFDMIYGRRFYRILQTKGKFFSSFYPFWN